MKLQSNCPAKHESRRGRLPNRSTANEEKSAAKKEASERPTFAYEAVEWVKPADSRISTANESITEIPEKIAANIAITEIIVRFRVSGFFKI
uniref:Uncharacterized protein n=1 Tax=Panagrolaimus davidi TaxID=227884 RepID=A0A914QJ68_9BILA